MSEDQEQKSIQLRALLAFALSAVVLYLYQHFMVKPVPPAPPVKTVVTVKDDKKAPEDRKTTIPPATGAEVAAGEQTFLVETDKYIVALTNRGAVATSWTLKSYT